MYILVDISSCMSIKKNTLKKILKKQKKSKKKCFFIFEKNQRFPKKNIFQKSFFISLGP